ncbi:AEC family transporter [Parvibaculum sp. MBR-TMA-1.3b-4.2]|jgi:predicted permease
MLFALSLVLPIFGVIALGYAASRSGLMSDEAIDGLDTYVFTFAMPCLLFRNLATTPFPDVLPWGLWASYYGAMLISWAVGSVIALGALRRPSTDAVMIGFGSAQGNTVMLGIPIIVTGFGEKAGFPVFLILAFHGIILFTVVTFLLELTKPRAEHEQIHFLLILKEAMKGTAKNPVIIGLVLGVVYGQTGLPMPKVANDTLHLIGRSAIPCALFVLGGMLTRYAIKRSIGAATLTSVLKLVFMPVLVFLASHYLFDMPPIWAVAATVLAGMPAGVYSSIMAKRYNAAPGAASSAVVLSTALSLITITLMLSYFLPKG